MRKKIPGNIIINEKLCKFTSFNWLSFLFKLGKIESIMGTIINTHTNGAKAQLVEKNNPKELDTIKAKGKKKYHNITLCHF